jgi:hypothetical protein
VDLRNPKRVLSVMYFGRAIDLSYRKPRQEVDFRKAFTCDHEPRYRLSADVYGGHASSHDVVTSLFLISVIYAPHPPTLKDNLHNRTQSCAFQLLILHPSVYHIIHTSTCRPTTRTSPVSLPHTLNTSKVQLRYKLNFHFIFEPHGLQTKCNCRKPLATLPAVKHGKLRVPRIKNRVSML